MALERACPPLRAGGEEAGCLFAGAGLAFSRGALAFFAVGPAFFDGGPDFTGGGLVFFAVGPDLFAVGPDFTGGEPGFFGTGFGFVEADAFVAPPPGAAARGARGAAARVFSEGREVRLAEVEPAEGGAIFAAATDFARTDL